MKLLFIKGLIFVLLFAMASAMVGQTVSDKNALKKIHEKRQLRQAQIYQRKNDHHSAIKILQILYNNNPGNFQYYRHLLNSFLEISALTQARQLLDKQNGMQPNNPQYQIDYGRLAFKAGQKEKALKIWNDVIKKQSHNSGIFTVVANVMIKYRLFDEALGIYERAYKANPNQLYLLKTIADFYRQQFNYEKAIQNYFAYLRKEPKNYRGVIRQILSFKIAEKQLDTILNLIRKEARASSKIPEIQIIVAKFLQQHHQYDEALQIYKRLENKQTKGNYLLEFARAVQSDSLYSLALQAYMEVIERFPKSNNILKAYLGAARSNLEIAKRNNDQTHSQQAIEIIHKVQKNFPHHPQVANLSLLEGDIYRQFFFDIDNAIKIYLAVAEKHKRNKKVLARAYISAGESYIIHGDLEKATVLFQKINEVSQKAKAIYYLAKIAFYQEKYQEANDYLDQVIHIQGLSGPIVNDALDLQSLLGHQQAAPEALKNYARANWLLFQQKINEALSKLQNALDQQMPPHFRIRVIIDAARLASEVGKFNETLLFCQQVLDDKTMEIFADQALFIIALTLDQKMGDFARAYLVYDRILAEFPESQFIIPARERLKEIRTQNPNLVP